jgi:hypothetical protein
MKSFYQTLAFRNPPKSSNLAPVLKRNLGERIRDRLITWLGDIKVFKPLPFLPPISLVYDPGSYKVTAAETRLLESLLQPGDILLRGYSNYLDGHIIPGFFSHAGVYLGKISDTDLPAGKKFATGDFIVAHSMAEGVLTEDLIGFCRADYLAVLRMPAQVFPNQNLIAYSYTDQENTRPEANLQRQLLEANTQGVSFAEQALPVIKNQALERLGTRYDFGFDFRNFNDMSCTEYVHWCFRALQSSHGIMPSTRRILLFIKRYMLAPDDLIAAQGSLRHIWASRSISSQTLQKLGWKA